MWISGFQRFHPLYDFRAKGEFVKIQKFALVIIFVIFPQKWQFRLENENFLESTLGKVYQYQANLKLQKTNWMCFTAEFYLEPWYLLHLLDLHWLREGTVWTKVGVRTVRTSQMTHPKTWLKHFSMKFRLWTKIEIFLPKKEHFMRTGFMYFGQLFKVFICFINARFTTRYF